MKRLATRCGAIALLPAISTPTRSLLRTPTTTSIISTSSDLSSLTSNHFTLARRFYATKEKDGDGVLHPGLNQTIGSGGDVESSPDTHPDFQPKPLNTTVDQEETEAIKEDMRNTIRDEEVVVFMKGLPEAPVCGFSKKMIDIMDALGLEYTSFDVLAHPIVRSYVKELSQWPTIPQLFIKGEFVGGCEIVLEMAENGGLQTLLEKNKIPHRPGKIFE